MPVLFNPFFQAIDGNGAPISGALLNFYQTGTTIRQNTYTDSTLASANLNPVPADSTGRFPPIYLAAAFDYKAILTDASGVTLPNGTRDPLGFTPSSAGNVVRSYLAGLTLSAAGGTGTFGIAAGVAADSTNVSMMSLAAAYTKTTAAWGVGSGTGSLDTGVIANTTWYHVHEIQRPDTGIVDFVTSLSATTPTLPTNYTLSRYIGSMKTDGSAHWIAFVQDNDLFQWVTPVLDINAVNPGGAAVTRTLGSVPTGVRVQARVQLLIFNGGAGVTTSGYLSDLNTADISPTFSSSVPFSDTSLAAGPASVNPGVQQAGARLEVYTNSSAQIRSRIFGSDANCTITINTLGWIDSRGRNV